MLVTKGSTNVSVELYIVDSTTGQPELGVVFNTAGIDLNYRRDLAAVVSITEVTLALLTTAHADGGFLEIGNGRYRLDVPDIAFATGVDKVTIGGTVTGMVVLPVEVTLTTLDMQTAMRGTDSAALASVATEARLAELDAANMPADIAAVPDAVLAAGDVDGFTLEEAMKLCLAGLAGKLAGAAGVTVTIQAADDSKARITATVDSDGNRTAVTLDAAG
jgi:hypothetical protein